jgi:tetratricopeptide (TPR) repeat protein
MAQLIILLMALLLATIVVALWIQRLRRPPPPAKQELIHQGVVSPIMERGSRWATARRRAGMLWTSLKQPHRTLPADTPWWRRVGPRRLGVGLAAAALVLFGLWRLPTLIGPTPDDFVVLIAPFRDGTGAPGATGRAAAAQLAALLPQATGGRVQARLLAEAPPDDAAALAALAREEADALISGSIAPGALLDQEALVPVLVYRPLGPYAPRSWVGYSTRFAEPAAMPLAVAPINGQIVLPRLLDALRAYGAGEWGTAATLDQLATDAPGLAPDLPGMLRANLLWARGDAAQAAAEYRRLLDSAADAARGDSGPLPPRAAIYANNLGVALTDAGDPAAARVAFGRAVALLNGRDLGALRVNLAQISLDDNHPDEARRVLEPAVNLLPASSELSLLLAETAWRNGEISQATTYLGEANRLADDAAAGDALRPVFAQVLRSELDGARARFALARASGARGPLFWDLALGEGVSASDLSGARDALDGAAQAADAVARAWREYGLARDAAGDELASQIAEDQAQRALSESRRRQVLAAAADIGAATAEARPRASGLAALWSWLFGDRAPAARARARLEELRKAGNDTFETRLLIAQSYLAGGQLDGARKEFEARAREEPNRPEPLYGLARLLEAKGDKTGAADLLRRAIALNPDYYPARMRLATLAQELKDPTTALEQRRWLAAKFVTPANRQALVDALIASGPAGYDEAQRLLLEDANSADAGRAVPALKRLSQLYVTAGNPAAARAALERANQLAPDDPTVAVLLGDALLQAGDTAGAQQAYLAALNHQRDLAAAHLGLARIAARQSPPAAATAQEEYAAALADGLDDPAALREIGDYFRQLGDNDTAARALERALDKSADDTARISVLEQLAPVYLELGRVREAGAAADRALKLSGEQAPRALVVLGDIALRDNKLDDADQRYARALQLDPGLADAYIGLGRVALARGRHAVAQSYYQKAIEAAPDTPRPYTWLGEALRRQGALRDAIAQFQQALQKAPNDAAARIGLARAQLDTGDLAGATATLQAVLDSRAEIGAARLVQGLLAERQNDLPTARSLYTRAIRDDSTLAEAYYLRARLDLRESRLASAVHDLERAVALQPYNPDAQYWLGRAYLASQQPDRAMRAFEAVVRQRPEDAEAKFYLGLAAEQAGKIDKAVRSLREALALDGAAVWDGEARAALTRLGNRP